MSEEQSDRKWGSAIRDARGPIIFAALIMACMIGYAWSVVDASRRTTDWLLILPVTITGVTALTIAAWRDLANTQTARQLTPETADADAPTTVPATATGSNDRVSLGLVLAVLIFAGAIPWIGFDLGTIGFVAAALLIQGERRWWIIGLTSVLTAVLLVLTFQSVLGVRVPTLLM